MSSTLHVRFNPVVRAELQSMSERSGLPESQVLTLLVRLAFRGAVPGLEALQPDHAPQLAPASYPTLNAPDVDDYEDPDDPTMPPF